MKELPARWLAEIIVHVSTNDMATGAQAAAGPSPTA